MKVKIVSEKEIVSKMKELQNLENEQTTFIPPGLNRRHSEDEMEIQHESEDEFEDILIPSS